MPGDATVPRSSPASARSATPVVLWLVAALCVASYLYLNVLSLRGAQLTDFSVYHQALQKVARGETGTIYRIDSKMPFLYPPFFLVLLRPLAGLDEAAAMSLWLYLQSAFLVVSLAALLAAFRGWDPVHAAFSVILFAMFSPVMLNNRYGQTNPLYLALLSLFVLGYVRGAGCGPAARVWETLAAAALSMAISIRVLPIGLLVMAVIQRRRFVAVLTVVLVVVEAIAAGAVAGFGNEWGYFTSYMFQLRGLENMREISLLGLLSEFLSGPLDVVVFVAIVALAIGVFFAKVIGPMRRATPSLVLHPAFVVNSMVLFAPLLEYHHYVILLASYVLVLGDLRQRRLCCAKGVVPVFISWAIVSAGNQLSYYKYRSLAFVALAGAALLWVYTIRLIAAGAEEADRKPPDAISGPRNDIRPL